MAVYGAILMARPLHSVQISSVNTPEQELLAIKRFEANK